MNIGPRPRALVCALVTVLILASARTDALSAEPASNESRRSRWFNQPLATGNWNGFRDRLIDSGVTIRFGWKGLFNSVVDGGLLQNPASFQQEWKLSLNLDLEKIAGVAGLSFDGVVRYRDGLNATGLVGGSPLFSPTYLEGGKGFRLTTLAFTWKSQNLLWTKDAIVARAGWIRPVDTFIQQTENRFFGNNAFTTNGIANMPWSGSYTTWRGELRVKPVDWHYIQLGLYSAFPGTTTKKNNGLDFDGVPYTPKGIFFIAETGFTPKIGPDRLPGKYAAGMFYWGIDNTGFDGGHHEANETYFLEADQMIFREHSTDKKLTSQGLYVFNLLTLSPPQNSTFPVFFQTGFLYEGLIPGRDADKLGFGFAWGQYSHDRIETRREAGQTTQRIYEAALELGYRVQVAKSSWIQPYIQYILNPGGENNIRNATVLGFHMGVDF
ncbi:MAG TPA: carbohydrate porin [Chthoniobacterales bacterium]